MTVCKPPLWMEEVWIFNTMIETMLMTSSSSSGINGISPISPIIVGSVGFTTTNVGKMNPKSYHIQNQQICHQQNQESTNGFLCKVSKDTLSSSSTFTSISSPTNNSLHQVRNGSSSNINMPPQAIGNGKIYRNGGSTTTIDNNNDTTSSSNGTCIILPSMTINSQSKTPYSDATQVRITGDK